MIYGQDCTLPKKYLERIAAEGLEAVPELMRMVINQAMQMEREKHLNAKPYERKEERLGHANDYKPKTVKTRMGGITFDIPQVREVKHPFPASKLPVWGRFRVTCMVIGSALVSMLAVCNATWKLRSSSKTSK